MCSMKPYNYIFLTKGGNLEGKSEQDQTRLDQEVIVYYVRKLETEQLQKMQMQNQVDRMQEQVSRLLSDKEFLRAQLKLQARVPTFTVPLKLVLKS